MLEKYHLIVLVQIAVHSVIYLRLVKDENGIKNVKSYFQHKVSMFYVYKFSFTKDVVQVWI